MRCDPKTLRSTAGRRSGTATTRPQHHPSVSFLRFATGAVTGSVLVLAAILAVLTGGEGRLGATGRLELVGAAVVATTELALLLGPLGRSVRRDGLAESTRSKTLLADNAFLDTVMEALDVGVAIVGDDGLVRRANATYRTMTGIADASSAPGVDITTRVDVLTEDGDLPIRPDELPSRLALRGESSEQRIQLRLPDGTRHDVVARARPLSGHTGEVQGAVVTLADVGQLAEQRRQLARRTEQLEAVASATQAVQLDEDARHAVCVVAQHLTGALGVSLFERVTPGHLTCTASAGFELVGAEIDLARPSLVATAFARGEVQFVADISEHDELDVGVTRRLEALVGSPIGAATYVPVRDGSTYHGMIIVAYSPSEHDHARDDLHALAILAAQAGVAIGRGDLVRRLEQEATTDPLTRLGNRRSWDMAIRLAVDRSRRLATPLCAAMLDVDHFKRFNDRLGHLAGDALLRDSSRAWSARLRAGDVICRVGGEEFAVLLPACTLDDAVRVVDALRAAMPPGATCSAGVAQLERGESAWELRERADQALYAAKSAGRDLTLAATPIARS